MTLFEYAPTAAHLGMTRAVAHADDQSPGWSDRAYTALVAAARRIRSPFTIEQLRAACDVDAPPDRRAWGAVVVRAAKAGAIRKTGGMAVAVSSNGSPKPLWEAVA